MTLAPCRPQPLLALLPAGAGPSAVRHGAAVGACGGASSCPGSKCRWLAPAAHRSAL